MENIYEVIKKNERYFSEIKKVYSFKDITSNLNPDNPNFFADILGLDLYLYYENGQRVQSILRKRNGDLVDISDKINQIHRNSIRLKIEFTGVLKGTLTLKRKICNEDNLLGLIEDIILDYLVKPILSSGLELLIDRILTDENGYFKENNIWKFNRALGFLLFSSYRSVPYLWMSSSVDFTETKLTDFYRGVNSRYYCKGVRVISGNESRLENGVVQYKEVEYYAERPIEDLRTTISKVDGVSDKTDNDEVEIPKEDLEVVPELNIEDAKREILSLKIKGLTTSTLGRILEEYPEYLTDILESKVSYDKIRQVKGVGDAIIIKLKESELTIRELINFNKNS